VDTPETIQAPPPTPRQGVSPAWRGLAILGLAAMLVLALLASKYAAALRHEQITDSAARAALSDRITSLEHDVVDAHGQLASLRQQLEMSGETAREALAPDSRIIHLAPLGAVPKASAVLAESPIKSKAVLLVSGLPPAPSGETYELWWIGPHGEAIKATSLHLDPQGAATATLTTPPADAHVVAGEVTLQPSKDDNTPGGTIYFRGATDER
jgi:hypothetical protein